MLTKLVQAVRKKVMKSKLITEIYTYVVCLMYRCDPIIPQKFTCALTYYISMGYWPDLNHPVNFNEKIQWLKINYRDTLLIKCADKYEVRRYVAGKGYDDILVNLIGIYDSVEQIDFSKLPDRFAMKCTNGCGSNLICQDKKTLNINEAKQQFKKWSKSKIGYISGEYHYNYIPFRIIVEENLCEDDKSLPLDYKIYCFNGEPHCVCVYADRDPITQETRRCYFDTQWNPLDYCTERYKTDYRRFEKPTKLDYMMEIAKSLSSDFPFVRVDLYEVKGRVFFGELTFTPTGGRGKAYNDECNELMGKLLVLPERSTNRKWKDYTLKK